MAVKKTTAKKVSSKGKRTKLSKEEVSGVTKGKPRMSGAFSINEEDDRAQFTSSVEYGDRFDAVVNKQPPNQESNKTSGMDFDSSQEEIELKTRAAEGYRSKNTINNPVESGGGAAVRSGRVVQYDADVEKIFSAYQGSESVASVQLIQRLLPATYTALPGEIVSDTEKAVYRIGGNRWVTKTIADWGVDIATVLGELGRFPVDAVLAVEAIARLDKGVADVLARTQLNTHIEGYIRQLLQGSGSDHEHREIISDETVIQSDTAETHDSLRRRGLAKALAIWINRFYERAEAGGDSFRIHLFGPWGAGKTTLLSLLSFALQPLRAMKEGETEYSEEELNLNWVIINFNAWRHQHIEPAWWPLYDLVYREGRRQLRYCYPALFIPVRIAHQLVLWIFESAWRLIATRLSKYLAVIAVLALAYSGWRYSSFSPGSDDVKYLKEVIGAVSAVIGLGATLYGAFNLWAKTLFEGSASAANTFIKSNPDPLHVMQRHFRHLIRVINKPVMIFIDDLDRCNPEYIVKLLESIQTLFSDSRVYFLVAADHRWLRVSYETVFKDIEKQIREPGKDLGALFLEKVFQLEIALPSVDPDVKNQYVRKLLGQMERPDIPGAAVQGDARSGQPATGGTMAGEHLVEDRIVSMAKAESEVEATHFLTRFSGLMPANPRSIKRIINTYGVNRAIHLSSEGVTAETAEIKRVLALWTILGLRWPVLQREMHRSPALIKEVLRIITSKKDAELTDQEKTYLPPKVVELLGDLVQRDDLRNVILFDGKTAALDEAAIKYCMGLERGIS